MANLNSINEVTAGGLVAAGYKKATGRKRKEFDLIVERIYMQRPSSDWVAFRWWAVKHNTAKSFTRVCVEAGLKDVVGKIIGHFTPGGDLSDAAQSLDGARQALQGDDQGIYGEKNAQLCGAVQLSAAKKMGPLAYNNCRKHGLIAHIYHRGAVRFEIVRSPRSGIALWLRGWSGDAGQRHMAGFGVSSKHPKNPEAIEGLKEAYGDAHGNYIYNHASGQVEDL